MSTNYHDTNLYFRPSSKYAVSLLSYMFLLIGACIFQELVNNKLDQSLFPYIKDQPAVTSTASSLRNSPAPQTQSLRSARPGWHRPPRLGGTVTENRQRLLVFVAGGMTYSEMRIAYQRSAVLGRDIYIGSCLLIEFMFWRRVTLLQAQPIPSPLNNLWMTSKSLSSEALVLKQSPMGCLKALKHLDPSKNITMKDILRRIHLPNKCQQRQNRALTTRIVLEGPQPLLSVPRLHSRVQIRQTASWWIRKRKGSFSVFEMSPLCILSAQMQSLPFFSFSQLPRLSASRAVIICGVYTLT